MVVGIGTDLVEVARFRRSLDRHGDRFEDRIFTEAERADCVSRADRVQALAARFAAKEAAMKAMGTGWAAGIGFRQIEVVRESNGRPRLRLTGAARERFEALGATHAHVSLSHQPSMASAVVVLEGAARSS